MSVEWFDGNTYFLIQLCGWRLLIQRLYRFRGIAIVSTCPVIVADRITAEGRAGEDHTIYLPDLLEKLDDLPAVSPENTR